MIGCAGDASSFHIAALLHFQCSAQSARLIQHTLYVDLRHSPQFTAPRGHTSRSINTQDAHACLRSEPPPHRDYNCSFPTIWGVFFSVVEICYRSMLNIFSANGDHSPHKWFGEYGKDRVWLGNMGNIRYGLGNMGKTGFGSESMEIGHGGVRLGYRKILSGNRRQRNCTGG